MDEREKLRKFRELDDAFADALAALDSGEAPRDMPRMMSAEARREADQLDQQERFERRVTALMQEYQQSSESVSLLMRTLQSLGKIA
ncbi:hypothetical protein SAMN05192555_10156 [Franzmannia pantelleriensis]|uniref:Uncharacterized protein n=1 Tax=Franzmannia pantelleriensis TaxID=48727 RepID=A0A1G9EBY6_9GAMM|nr:hypothetical protein [Halomonas pantelleriensis]SDK73545.1 hypothetical protein SAMN05192555_10156 [Halomonas pantelleriensis]